MSHLTAQLLNRPAPRQSVWQARFVEVANRLVDAHGIPRLGNYRDPVREIFYILLSAKTTDSQYRRTYRQLSNQFSTLSAIATAKVKQILSCIESGGLANKRAGQIKRTAAALIAVGGDNPSRRLREMNEQELFAFLTNLPGMGPKSAFCVMMYSLDVDVFPVDANVQRIAERMGAIPTGLKHYQAQQRLPSLIPLGRSRELHITMVAHGRKVCLPRVPKCGECCIRELCKQGRVTAAAERNARVE
jgi:endonuclease III